MRLKTVLGTAFSTALAIVVAPLSRADIVTYDTSLASPPGLYFGIGNTNSNFTVATSGNNELGLSVIQRYVGAIDPGAGSNVYQVTPGVTTAPGNNGGSTWGVDFSVNTQYNPGTGSGSAVLGDFRYAITIQDLTQPAISGPFVTPFDPVRGIPDDNGYGPSGVTNGVNITTQWGAQNSEAPSFAFFLPAFQINAPDLYQITLSEYDGRGALVDQDTVFANAGPPVPEPTSVVLLGTLALGAFVLGRRKLATKPGL